MAPAFRVLKQLPSSWFGVISYLRMCFLGSKYHRNAAVTAPDLYLDLVTGHWALKG